jgi:hypothetical protein
MDCVLALVLDISLLSINPCESAFTSGGTLLLFASPCLPNLGTQAGIHIAFASAASTPTVKPRFPPPSR